MNPIANAKNYQLENYRKFLLNRVTASSHIVEFIETALASEDEAAPHSFHKIMVHNWSDSDIELYDTLSEYFSSSFVPVTYTSQDRLTTFYTSSLTLILKMAKLDFMFPHQRNMFNVDVLFNDKSSADCFENRVTIENVVAGVVSGRLNTRFELDLSDFCNDPEFKQKKIHFYKLNLLSHFKILMLRIGRDTKILNLSNNNLSQAPVEIINFFIKGDLIAINLSNNNIPSLSELQRISSKIEKLWIEGNPLCDELDPVPYVKQIVVKFPRLLELDGIRLNEHGIPIPFYRNYLEIPDKRTKMVVEKFISLYFAHYDSSSRRKINKFYGAKATLTISTNFSEGQGLDHYFCHSRNIINPIMRRYTMSQFKMNKMYSNRQSATAVLCEFPDSIHDPSTFTIDVLKHDKRCLLLVVEGIYKEKTNDQSKPERFLHFRRTFIFNIQLRNNLTYVYYITNEMFNVSLATQEQIDSSFKNPAINTNPLALRCPDQDDCDAICNIFSHISQLKRTEAELRLKIQNWDMKRALKEFFQDLKLNKISPDKFIDEDDFSDSSSLMEEIE